MKISTFQLTIALLLLLATSASAADPHTNSWLTSYAGQYARVYLTDTDKINGTSVTTWSRNSLSQNLPVYSGVREIYSSASWVYIRAAGLGIHTMGPWYTATNHATVFMNVPVNTKVFYRIPRSPATNGTHAQTGGGPIGYFVDGVAMFDSRDAFYWNGSTEVNGAGSWNRDAYVNESQTFDPAYAHQPASGQYHYHANAPALRYLLGDHVDFNATNKMFTESTNLPTQHSPILGWVRDGFPIYGPYGYANPTNPASGVRRMMSGYVPRNGLNGTDNLSTNGAIRSAIPAWATRAGESAMSGPTVSTNISSFYPFGRYLEDNAYLGDLTNSVTGSNFAQGVDFDLNEYNARWCVTPEFPDGTWAYFTCITTNGAPAFPYNIGRTYCGNTAGAAGGNAVTSLTEAVTTNYVGGAKSVLTIAAPNVSNNVVTLTWSATEGGTYQVATSANLATWTTNITGVAAVLNQGQTPTATVATNQFFKVIRTGLAPYDTN